MQFFMLAKSIRSGQRFLARSAFERRPVVGVDPFVYIKLTAFEKSFSADVTHVRLFSGVQTLVEF